MMTQYKSSKDLWNKCQDNLPKEFQQDFVEGISFCIQERDLRDALLSNDRIDIWLKWKRSARPLIRQRVNQRYAPKNYQQQQETEQSQRGSGWQSCLNSFLNSSGVSGDGKILVAGANNGIEVRGLHHRNIYCVDICDKALESGRLQQPFHQFQYGRLDRLPFIEGIFDAYISLRTWCVAGVLPDEALSEAKRVIKKRGAIIVSFPLSFPQEIPCEKRKLSDAIDNHIKPIAEWTKELFSSRIILTNCRAEPEDYFFLGRT